ncbi:mechanosensitive ion channel family protein [Palleronia abyssalis]|uniref:Small-conductance mechanosensitive channel n=1 Tax=Palleronia abyssalis TaxID=1501240 RepID=A0A2R8BRH0_9RHOB|nr:Small-conductance mechanosensitive channel [Palleronia abyssalis]
MEQILGPVWDTLPEPMRVQMGGYATAFWRALPQIVLAVVFLALVWLAVRMVNWIVPKALGRARMRRAMRDVIVMLLTVGLWLMGVLTAATIAFPSITPGEALAALGVGGVAIGFAFRDVFENFLAGILLLIREPFSKSDFIECQGIDGQVEDITIRDTHIRQTDGQLVVAPNAMFFKNPVTIRTATGLRRTTIIVGVAYGEDVDAAREVITEAVRHVDTVRDDVKDVQIFAQEFGDSSINFEVTWWTGSKPVDIRRSRDKVVAAVKRALDETGIEIPFPYRTLTFKEPLPIRQRDDDA